jgi:superfamily II DNA/RNA helicase
LIFAGKDVVIQAQTGSGKTLVYCLPILSKIDPKHAAIQAVVVVPTRELGIQVTGVFRKLTKHSPEKILTMLVAEGSRNKRQKLWALAEPPKIVVGNPEALLELIEDGRLRMNSVSFVVVDEVDASLLKTENKQVAILFCIK